MKARLRSIWRLFVYSWLAAALSCSSTEAPKKAGDPPKIINFYATPPTIAKGEDAMLCYGTESVTGVKIDPAVESLKPALSRCFQVKPETTTEYTLTVTGPGGEASQKATVTVSGVKKPDPPATAQELIRFFVSDTQEGTPGAKVTLCYGVRGASSVSMTPGYPKLPVADKHCMSLPVARTTTFTLEAKSASGTVDRMKLTVKIRQ
jgi:hypothetical protein